jgi:hypothetical protein
MRPIHYALRELQEERLRRIEEEDGAVIQAFRKNRVIDEGPVLDKALYLTLFFATRDSAILSYISSETYPYSSFLTPKGSNAYLSLRKGADALYNVLTQRMDRFIFSRLEPKDPRFYQRPYTFKDEKGGMFIFKTATDQLAGIIGSAYLKDCEGKVRYFGSGLFGNHGEKAWFRGRDWRKHEARSDAAIPDILTKDPLQRWIKIAAAAASPSIAERLAAAVTPLS